MQQNVAIFSAAKTWQQASELASLVVNDKGQQREWKSFKEEALKVAADYNVHYLRTEYDTAVAAGQMAGLWKQMEATVGPDALAMYDTVGDARVRPEHQKWDRIIRPLSDDFWNTHWPPNGYNCRCTVRFVNDGEVTEKVPGPDEADVPPVFRVNVGKSAMVFGPEHPYYQVPDDKMEVADKAISKLLGEDVSSINPVPKFSEHVVFTSELKARPDLLVTAQKGLDLIDAVHGDGGMKQVTVVPGDNLRRGVNGQYDPMKPEVSFKKTNKTLDTVIHELGHHLDRTIVDLIVDKLPIDGDPRDFIHLASKLSAVLKKDLKKLDPIVGTIIGTTKKLIKGLRDNDHINKLEAEFMWDYGVSQKKLEEYILSPQELFARFYPQYIAHKTQEKELTDFFASRRNSIDPEERIKVQDEETVKKLVPLMDKLLAEVGWKVHNLDLPRKRSKK